MTAGPVLHVAEEGNWLVTLRRYVVFAGVANLSYGWFYDWLPRRPTAGKAVHD